MQAALLYGPKQINLEQLPEPQISAHEVLVKIDTATTCGTDLKVFLRGGHARMLTPPSVFGHEFSGTVAAVGSAVRGFVEGMRVVANNSAPCYQCYYCRRHLPNLCDDLLFINGAYAEYIAIPKRLVRTNLLVLPDHLPFAVACLTEPLACVLHCLDQSTLRAGETVVVNGDGPSGLMMAAAAAWRGARVILCGRAPQRLSLAKQLGVDSIVDYSAVADQAEAVRDLTDERRGVDLAIEAVGKPEVWKSTVRMVRKGGQAIFYGGCPSNTTVEIDTRAIHYDQLNLLGVFHNTPYHVRLALDLLAKNVIPGADLITHALPLEQLHHAFNLMLNRQALKVAIRP